jgi:hypothetical protein
MPSLPGTPRHRPLADHPWVSTLVGGLLAVTLAGSIVALVLVREAPAPGVGGDPGGGTALRSQAVSAPIHVTGPQPSPESPAGTPGPGAFPELERESGAALPLPIGETANIDGGDGGPESLDNAEDPAPPGDETTPGEQNEETSPPEETSPAERTSEGTRDENPEPGRTQDENPEPGRTQDENPEPGRPKDENPEPEQTKSDSKESHGQPKENDRTPPGQAMPPSPHPGHGESPPGRGTSGTSSRLGTFREPAQARVHQYSSVT